MLRSIIVSVLAVQMTASLAWASDIRRVVTGLDASNRSVALFDSEIHLKDIQRDLGLGYLWVTHAFPVESSAERYEGERDGHIAAGKWNTVRRGRVSTVRSCQSGFADLAPHADG